MSSRSVASAWHSPRHSSRPASSTLRTTHNDSFPDCLLFFSLRSVSRHWRPPFSRHNPSNFGTRFSAISSRAYLTCLDLHIAASIWLPTVLLESVWSTPITRGPWFALFPISEVFARTLLVHHSDTKTPTTADLVSYRPATAGESPCQRQLLCWPHLGS